MVGSYLIIKLCLERRTQVDLQNTERKVRTIFTLYLDFLTLILTQCVVSVSFQQLPWNISELWSLWWWLSTKNLLFWCSHSNQTNYIIQYSYVCTYTVLSSLEKLSEMHFLWQNMLCLDKINVWFKH